MIEKSVVTCFVEHDGKILLLKRSDKVGSFQGRWAGVSGYLESNSKDQAYTEIREELGLTKEDIDLLVQGPMLSVKGTTDLSSMWHVHLFLFHLDDPDKIRLDWEHTDWQFVYPSEIGNFETVPKLEEALKIVLQSACGSGSDDRVDIQIGMGLLTKDQKHGASWLSDQAVHLLERWVQKWDGKEPRKFLEDLEKFCQSILSIRPSMLSIGNRLHLIFHRIREETSTNERISETKLFALDVIHRERSQNQKDKDLLTDRFLPHLPENATVLTTSYSHTVIDLLTRCKNRIQKVIVTESRPLCEGARTAKRLNREGIRTELITDAASGLFLKECNLVLTGCDMVVYFPPGNRSETGSQGWMVNKTGTYPLAVLAKHEQIPFITACERYKLIHPDITPDSIEHEEKDPSEILSGDHPFPIRNIYFDRTPLDLVTLITPEPTEDPKS